MLLALPVLVYRSRGESIVERRGFDLTKIRGRIRREEDCASICREYIRDSGARLFYIFSRNPLPPGGGKPYKGFFVGSGGMGFRSKMRNPDSRYYKFPINDWEYRFGIPEQFARNKTDSNRNELFAGILSSSCEKLSLGVDRPPELDRYESISGSESPDKFPDSCPCYKKLTNRGRFWWRRKIIRNLWNWGESDGILIGASFSLKEGDNLRPLNCIEFRLCRLLRNHFRNSGTGRQETGKTSKYLFSYDEPTDPEFFVTLENTLSDLAYRFSRYISYGVVRSNIGTMDTNFSNEDMTSIEPNHAFMDGESERDGGDKEFVVTSDEFLDPDSDGCSFEWMEKDSRVRDMTFVKPVLIHSTVPNKYLFFMEKRPDAPEGSLVSGGNEYIVSGSFLQRGGVGIKNFPESIRYASSEILSIDEFGQEGSILDRDFDKISRDVGGTHHLGDPIESDDNEVMNLWKIQKYYPNLLHLSPKNPAHSMIRRNNSMNGGIMRIFRRRWNRLLIEIVHLLLPILSRYGRPEISIDCMKLGISFVKKSNGLDILVKDGFDGVGDAEISQVLPLNRIDIRNSGNSDGIERNKSISHYLFIGREVMKCGSEFVEDLIRVDSMNFRNSIRGNCNRYFGELLNDAYPEAQLSPDSGDSYTRKYAIHEYSIAWRGITKEAFIRDVEDVTCNGLTLEVCGWVGGINNLKNFSLSKDLASRNFSARIGSPQFLGIFIQDFDSGGTHEILNPTWISADIRSTNPGRNQLLDRFKRFINHNLIGRRPLNKRGTDPIAGPFMDGATNNPSTNLFDRFILFGNVPADLIMNNESIPTPDYTRNYSSDSSNRSRNPRESAGQLFSHPEEMTTRNYNDAIYWQFLCNVPKYHEFLSNISGMDSSQEKIASVARSRLLPNALLSEAPQPNLQKSQFPLFPYFIEKLPSQIYSHSPNILSMIRSKQEMNEIGTTFRYQFLLDEKDPPGEIHSEESVRDVSVPRPDNARIETYYDVSRSESLRRRGERNNETFQSMNGFYTHSKPEYFDSRGSEGRFGNQILRNADGFCRYNRFGNPDSFVKYALFKNHIPWFFTSEWWEYHAYIFVEISYEVSRVVAYRFEHLMVGNLRIVQKSFKSLWDRRINPRHLNSKWDSRFSVDYQEEAVNHAWSGFRSTSNWNTLHWVIITSAVLISLSYRNHLSILIGSDSIDLWGRFETIKYLTDTSRAFRFTKLLRRNETRLSGAENAVIYFLRNSLRYAKNIRFHLLTETNLKKWLISNRSLDLPRRKRNLSIQSLITHARIKEYEFQSHSAGEGLLDTEFGYRVTHQQGLLYLQYLAEILRRNLVNHPLHLANKWIFFASLQRIILSRRLWQAEKFDPEFQEIPVPLQFGLSRSKGILLIGPGGTGRSYLIKNLAAGSYAPLLRVSINKLLYNKPDAITESRTNIPIESLRRLNLVLDLARKVSPCMIWIQDIHRLNVNRSTQNVESDPTFLLGILLKHLQTDSGRTQIRDNIIIIGSTHLPKRIDPALISPNRSNRVINTRLFSNSQRENQFTVLLSGKHLFMAKRSRSYFNDFGSRTVGYNTRDLAALTREVSLISLTRNELFIYTDTMELAFHRQVSNSTHTDDEPRFQQNLGVVLYKIGRALIQNIFVRDSATNPLSIGNYLRKKKFYYLSKWYSEPPPDESIIKESVVLTHVLGCLAGAAARDSWFLPKKDSDASVPLDKLIENDLDLASSILENLSIEFPWLETRGTRFVDNEEKGIATLSTINFSSIVQDGIFAIAGRSIIRTINDFRYRSLVSRRRDWRGYEFRGTAWSPRSWRLSFLRGHSFNRIERLNNVQFSSNSGSLRGGYSFPNNLEVRNRCSQLVGRDEERFIYERILPRMRERNVQELESQFEQILSEEESEILGFFHLSTEHRMEYELGNKPGLFIGKRILWDPIGSFLQIRRFVIPRREFFVDEEMLRRLYVTYGARRERERSRSSHRIKRFFVRRGYDKDLIGKLSVRWWNQQLLTDEGEDTGTLKRIERIGIQLKRPRIFTPVYLYQRWLIENLPEKFPRFELLIHRQRWLEITNSLLSDSLIHTTPSESYQYLLKSFASNRILLNRMTKMLLRKGWLFQDEIEDLIRYTR